MIFLHFFAAEPCAPHDKLVSVRRSACKPLLPGISPGVSASLVCSISVLASLPRRPYPLSLIHISADRLACIVSQMQKAEAVTEELKARDPMRWVGLMNTLKVQVEETIFQELIFQ